MPHSYNKKQVLTTDRIGAIISSDTIIEQWFYTIFVMLALIFYRPFLHRDIDHVIYFNEYNE